VAWIRADASPQAPDRPSKCPFWKVLNHPSGDGVFFTTRPLERCFSAFKDPARPFGSDNHRTVLRLLVGLP
jgi:hypothetical protein